MAVFLILHSLSPRLSSADIGSFVLRIVGHLSIHFKLWLCYSQKTLCRGKIFWKLSSLPVVPNEVPLPWRWGFSQWPENGNPGSLQQRIMATFSHQEDLFPSLYPKTATRFEQPPQKKKYTKTNLGKLSTSTSICTRCLLPLLIRSIDTATTTVQLETRYQLPSLLVLCCFFYILAILAVSFCI